MPVQVQDTIRKATDKWKSFTKNQQIKIGIISALIVLSLAATIYLYAKPTYEEFLSNQEYTTINAVRDLFDNNQIQYEIRNNATSIWVLAKHFTDARLLYSSNPEVAGKEFGLADAMGFMGMGTTQTEKRLAEQELINEKVRKLVLSVNGVAEAIVAITPPEESSRLFPSHAKATASITIRTEGINATKATGKVIQNLAASAVQGLLPENVYVADQNGTIAGNNQDEFSDLSERQQSEETQKRALASQVESLLVGNYDIVVAEPFIPFVWDLSESKQTIISTPIEGSTRGALISESIRESSVEQGANGEVPGVDANNLEDVPLYPQGEGTTANAETLESDSQYAFNTEERTSSTVSGIPDWNRARIAVVVYSNKVYKEEDVEARGLLTDKNWQDYQDEIKRERAQFEIDENVLTLISNSTGIDQSRISILHYENPIFVNKPVEVIDFGVYASIGTLIALLALLALSLIKKTEPEEITEVEPELSVEELLVSTQQEPEKQSVAEIEEQGDSELKKQLDKFVEEKPEAVAQLLRNWLSDEWE